MSKDFMRNRLKDTIAEKIKGKVLFDEPMKFRTSFRIGGPADIWVEPRDTEDIKNCIELSRSTSLPLTIIGGGTNILVKDGGIRGIVLNMLTPALKHIEVDGYILSATSSVSISELLKFCPKHGLGGLEFLTGIPGSVGGALMNNVAARDYEMQEKWYSIGDFVQEVKVINYMGFVEIIRRDDISFEYRSSDLSNCIILEAKFFLTGTPRETTLKRCQKFLERKKATQELTLPSAGCVFKNPSGIDKSAGRLIDECGLKGRRVGSAEISNKHANFIVNTGNATSRDVVSLIDITRKSVKDNFGVELSLEIKIV